MHGKIIELKIYETCYVSEEEKIIKPKKLNL